MWMHPNEIKLINSFLTIDDIMLEWGSGGSTAFFAQQVKTYYSIEHVKEWYDRVNKQLEQYPLLDVRYNFVPNDLPRTKPTQYNEYKSYIEYPKKFNTKFDRVLIDGRGRQYCAEFILPYLHEESIVFIHDFYNRPDRYDVVLQWYDIVDGIDNTEQTIVALKAK